MGACEGKTEPETPEVLDLTTAATVAIVSARGLRNADNFLAGKSDSFVVLKVLDDDGGAKEVYKTKVKNDTLDPVWKEEARIPPLSKGQSLEFSVWDADLIGMRDFLGKVVLESTSFWESGFNGELRLENAGEGQMAYLRLKVKHRNQGYPPGPPPEVQITLSRDNLDVVWGLALDSQDGTLLYVDGVEDKGPVRKYNEGVEPALQVKTGDFILTVNGHKGDAHTLLSLLKAQTKAELVVRRATEFDVTIVKEVGGRNSLGKGMRSVLPGLELRRTPQGACLVVREVTEDWNPLKLEGEVQVQDRIIAVGDVRGSADALLKELKSRTGEVEVTFCRPDRPTK